MITIHRLIKMLCFYLIIITAYLSANAHSRDVHKEMSISADQASQGVQNFLDDVFGSGQDPIFTSTTNGKIPPSATGSTWIARGSRRADDVNFLNGEPSDSDTWIGCRCEHHFFDPINHQGLTDQGSIFPILVVPQPSYSWVAGTSGDQLD